MWGHTGPSHRWPWVDTEQVVVEHVPWNVPLTVTVANEPTETFNLDAFVRRVAVFPAEHQVGAAIFHVARHVQADHTSDRAEGLL